ncbi:hypothetical protein ACIA6C_30320 [Streptomyces sp. NPDC051578]|uniref:hypothetical protein n=1 Tax=Streptomyces sp. NPDC051578 TaxID=3365662 RepID=UPI0037A7B16C
MPLARVVLKPPPREASKWADQPRPRAPKVRSIDPPNMLPKVYEPEVVSLTASVASVVSAKKPP